MKVLIINTIDKGGAANSCKRLHLGLLKQKYDSSVLLLYKVDFWPKSTQFKGVKKSKSRVNKIYKKMRRILGETRMFGSSNKNQKDKSSFIKDRDNGLEAFSFPDSPHNILESEQYKNADIINLHWVANFLDYSSFFENNRKPVIWTLHDMNPFTGGEHYEEHYLGISNEGFPEKRITSKSEEKLFGRIKIIKKEALENTQNLTIVAPSKWLYDAAKKSEIFAGKDVRFIPYGIENEIYQARNKRFSRQLLGIPQDKKVLLFVADSIDNNRKGFVYLKRALEKMNNPDIVLCALGAVKEGNVFEGIIYLGQINDERLMSAAYSSADVFVIPSLMDNLPNTVLESLMCGTPVIGFPVGGIPDMIEHSSNGLLSKDVSVDDLKDSIELFFKIGVSLSSDEISENARRKYSLDIQAKKYISLYSEVLK